MFTNAYTSNKFRRSIRYSPCPSSTLTEWFPNRMWALFSFPNLLVGVQAAEKVWSHPGTAMASLTVQTVLTSKDVVRKHVVRQKPSFKVRKHPLVEV